MRCLEIVCRTMGFSQAQQLLDLSSEQARRRVLQITQAYLQRGKFTMARQIRITTKGFFEANDKELKFKRAERIRKIRTKVSQEIIPDKETVYRMAGVLTNPRDRAILLCLFQSGARVGCLVNWTVGLVRDQLYPKIKIPVRLRITNKIDTKLTGYGPGYYYAFLQEEAAEALRTYLDQRLGTETEPGHSAPLFTPIAKHARKNVTDEARILGIIKKSAKRIGLDSKNIWTHCLRKTFSKILNASDIDEDTKEALMGHTLPGSRGSYFDMHDIDEIATKYMKANFSSRLDVMAELEQRDRTIQELHQRLAQYETQMKRLTRLSDEEIEAVRKLIATKKAQNENTQPETYPISSSNSAILTS